MNRQALKEVVKSFGRFMWFGVLGLLSTFLVSLAADQDLMNAMWTTPFLDVTLPVGVYLVAGIAFATKAIDRYVHENEDTELTGITPQDFLGQ